MSFSTTTNGGMPSINVLGTRIHCFNSTRELYEKIVTDRRSGAGGRYVTVNNVHTVMEAYRHAHFKKIINEGYLSIPDGKPLVVVGKLKGKVNISRLFGPTVMEQFIDWGRKDDLKHFIFGSTEQIVSRLISSINSKYPGAEIVGMIIPPFGPTSQWDNAKYFEQINNSKADIVWVGLGAPKQEKWMQDNKHLLNYGVMFGVGAAFSYIAGITQHAPGWMKRNSLEWLYRLAQEPTRLWKRYLKTIPPFMLYATLDVISHRLQPRQSN